MHPCTRLWLKAFEEIPVGEREEAVEDMEAFLGGFREGQAEVEEETFGPSEGEPSVLSESSGDTLAEMMTDLNIVPGSRGVLS